MDYGQPIQFGTFITPTAADPGAVVDAAVLSEQLGFDVVTFQDHPYQPSFLDTWTLLSWVAARTERVHLSGNVLNLPLRPPAVLARAAASLDLLSGGRVALGIGAGVIWDPIAAMGGPRRTPGQSVDALTEAIAVIRGIWDTSDRSPLRIEGEHYRLDGAKRGPAPAHDIPIWIGALKPRMLRLTGRSADGWLPSLAYLQPGDLERGSRIIDEAGIAAGREPGEIRRLLNINGRFTERSGGMLDGPPEQWVDQLLELVLQHGTSTFILASDDPDVLRTFAAEVVPALREVVDRERQTSRTVARSTRSAAARAKRHDTVDYDSIPLSLAAGAVEPGDREYERVRSTYTRGGSPALVLRPRSVDEVVEALAYARSNPDAPLATRSGGHGFSGRSTNHGGVVIDLHRLNEVTILDATAGIVRVGPGARWVEVAASLRPYDLAISSGDHGGVGVGGLATAGGIGWLAREHGLTIDHLRAVELVLADGSLVRASADEQPDLFWAVRGAGANFGIAVAFEFQAAQVSHELGFGRLVLDSGDPAALLQAWGAAVQEAPRDLTAEIILTPPRRGAAGRGTVLAVVDSSEPDVVIDRMQRLADTAPLLDATVQLMSYAELMAMTGGTEAPVGRGEPHSRSGLIEHVTPEFATAAAELLATGAVYWFHLRSLGGAVSDVPPDATAFGHRSAAFSVAALGANDGSLTQAWDSLREHMMTGIYLSFETGLDDGRIADAFPPATLDRLRSLKSRFDPDNVFRDNFALEASVPSES